MKIQKGNEVKTLTIDVNLNELKDFIEMIEAAETVDVVMNVELSD